MRSRKEIEDELKREANSEDYVIIELLLDIRDLLMSPRTKLENLLRELRKI